MGGDAQMLHLPAVAAPIHRASDDQAKGGVLLTGDQDLGRTTMAVAHQAKQSLGKLEQQGPLQLGL
jgi:hypothetical protein